MYSVMDWFKANKELIEPCIFLVLFYGIANVAFPSKQARGLVLALGMLLGFSYLEWAQEHTWEFVRWGVYASILIYLVIYRTALNFNRNSKADKPHIAST